jgi:hypothetical protein
VLSYRLQKRHFKVVEGQATFPNTVRVEMRLAPPTPFGGSVGGGRTATRAVGASMLLNANTGRTIITSVSAFAPVDLTIQSDNMTFKVKGDLLSLDTTCDTLNDLAGLVESVYHLFPAIANVEFGDPPTVLHVSGSIGSARFRWELAALSGEARPTTTEEQEQRLARAWVWMSLFGDGRNRRLAAAVHYFHVGSRLLAAGDSPWEFMGEVILNFAKTLQALFGQRGQEVRAGLRALGYSADEIEHFITVMGLRDEFDSGHIMLSLMEEEQARSLYLFIQGRELRFQTLLKRALEAVAQGDYRINEEPDLTSSAQPMRSRQNRCLKVKHGRAMKRDSSRPPSTSLPLEVIQGPTLGGRQV